MRIDLNYLKDFLDEFLKADTAHLSLKKIYENGFPVFSPSNNDKFDEKFLFHLQIIMENNLISDKNLKLSGFESIGIIFERNERFIYTEKEIRLTNIGHDFANALSKKEVFEKLKIEFKDAPFKVIFDGSQKLLQHFFQKKLDDLLDE